MNRDPDPQCRISRRFLPIPRTYERWLLVIALLVGAPFGQAMARDLYVSRDGDDAKGTGTRSSPYRTCAKALAMAKDGDAILLGPHSFFEKAFTTKNITLRTYSSASAVGGFNQPPEIVSRPLWTPSTGSQPGTLVAKVSDSDRYPLRDLAIRWSKESGPGEVTFSSPGEAKTSVRFNANGRYRLRIDVHDGEKSATEAIDVDGRVNEPPRIDRVWVEPSPVPVGARALLKATVFEGIPARSDQELSWRWESVDRRAGIERPTPGTSTGAVFLPEPGNYELDLVGGFGESEIRRRLTVVAVPNSCPSVAAGDDQEHLVSVLPIQIQLQGSVQDDGGTGPTTLLKRKWSVVDTSLVGSVTFDDTSIDRPVVTVHRFGAHTLRLTASDGTCERSNDLILKVWQYPIPTKPACTSYFVQAGNDRTLASPTNRTVLHATLEGLPFGCTSAMLADFSVRWSQIAGPAGAVATIAHPTRNLTEVFLPTPGVYVFKVSMDDPSYGTDQVTVTVLPPAGGGASSISGTVSLALPGKRGLAPEVEVEAILKGIVVSTTKTDNRGRFTLSGLSAGSYTLRARYEGYEGRTVGRTVNGRSSLRGVAIAINRKIQSAGLASTESEKAGEAQDAADASGKPSLRVERDDFGATWVIVEDGIGDRTLVVESSTDMQHWQPLEVEVVAGTAIEVEGETPQQSGGRFYRVRAQSVGRTPAR